MLNSVINRILWSFWILLKYRILWNVEFCETKDSVQCWILWNTGLCAMLNFINTGFCGKLNFMKCRILCHFGFLEIKNLWNAEFYEIKNSVKIWILWNILLLEKMKSLKYTIMLILNSVKCRDSLKCWNYEISHHMKTSQLHQSSRRTNCRNRSFQSLLINFTIIIKIDQILLKKNCYRMNSHSCSQK